MPYCILCIVDCYLIHLAASSAPAQFRTPTPTQLLVIESLFSLLSSLLLISIPPSLQHLHLHQLPYILRAVLYPHQNRSSYPAYSLSSIAMRLLRPAFALLGAASLVAAAPIDKKASDFDRELPDGLPYPSPSELALVEQNAHGTLPNTSPPPVISNKGITNLQLIAFNELFEVAFFNELVTNITENVEGYRFSDPDDKNLVVASLKAILAVSQPSIIPYRRRYCD